jgi:flagellar motility protein MotE (MotC chaperone)
MKYFRLLPAVILVGVALLGFKGEGLVRAAWAQDQQTASADDTGAAAPDTAPLAKDPATEDSRGESAAEIDVLSSLAKRRAALDAREADIEMRSQVLTAAEARVNDKIATLKKLQDQITALIGQRDTEEQKQIASLVKTYSAMKPKDAARIFNSLSDDVLVPVAQAMKSDVLAPILASMSPDNAQKLTIKLASRLKLPETAAQAAPTPVAPAAAPTTSPAANAAQATAAPAPAAAAAQTAPKAAK